jgi:hypothetical protein
MSPRESCDVLPDEAWSMYPSAESGSRKRRTLDEYARDEPLTALAIAVTAGFILGGGAATRAGRAALGFVGQVVLRRTVGNLIVGILMGSYERGTKQSENRS